MSKLINIRADELMQRQLDELMEKTGLSQSDVIRLAVRELTKMSYLIKQIKEVKEKIGKL